MKIGCYYECIKWAGIYFKVGKCYKAVEGPIKKYLYFETEQGVLSAFTDSWLKEHFRLSHKEFEEKLEKLLE